MDEHQNKVFSWECPCEDEECRLYLCLRKNIAEIIAGGEEAGCFVEKDTAVAIGKALLKWGEGE